jgi:protein ImuB
MLWLCLHLPRLPVEALGLDGAFDVVTEQRGASRWLITAAPGVGVGMPLGTALSLQPLLRAQSRHVKAERAALQALAYRLYRYGTPVHAELREFDETGRAPQALLWLEVSASLRLFGGYPNLQAQLGAEFADGRHQIRMAVAPTRAAAALFACAGVGVKVRGPAALARRLASRPIAELPWRKAQIEALHGVGLRRIGELRALPRKAFARRFGADRLLELDRLYGDAAEPAEAIVPPPTFQRRFELPGDVEQLEALQFPLRRLAYDLQGWLRALDVSVRELRLYCLHARERRPGRTIFTVRFLDAHRDATRIFNSLCERLAREPLGAAVRALELRAIELGAAQATQADLFDSGNGQAEWTVAVERIAARLGPHAVWRPAPQADQRPDRAWRNDGEMQTASARPRPLWLLHQPQVLPGEPDIDAAVERIESGWWDGADQRRDYYVAEWQKKRVWVFRERDGGRWFLHGLWG